MPACLAASTRRAYSSAFRVNSTVRVRGTGCRGRRLPCPPGPAGLPPLMVPAIADAPAGRAEFLTTFVLPPAEFLCGGFPCGHALLPEYVRTAPGPDVKGVLALHLASRPWRPPSPDPQGAG